MRPIPPPGSSPAREVSVRRHGMGLLIHLQDVEPGGEDAARAAMEEYIGRRMEVPGVWGVASYEAIKGSPRFLTLLEAESVHVFYSEPFLALAAGPGGHEAEAARRRTAEVRLVCAQLYPGLPAPSPACPTVDVAGLAPVVQVGRIHVPPDKLEDFNGWYAQDRAPRMERLPGMRRFRRYAPVEGEPVMVVFYEMENEAVQEQAGWKEASSTPWSGRVRGYYRQAPGSPGVYRRLGGPR